MGLVYFHWLLLFIVFNQYGQVRLKKTRISITNRHFPNMIHFGDITKVRGREIPPVHIITFDSPCQNLSNTGKREGLTGSQSSLFYHAIRIIEEMRCATNDTYPVIAGGKTSWQILEEHVSQKYYLKPANCNWFLRLAERTGCPPPSPVEYVFKKQGGKYPPSVPFKNDVCKVQPKKNEKVFHGSFGRTGDPILTLLAGTVNYFTFW